MCHQLSQLRIQIPLECRINYRHTSPFYKGMYNAPVFDMEMKPSRGIYTCSSHNHCHHLLRLMPLFVQTHIAYVEF